MTKAGLELSAWDDRGHPAGRWRAVLAHPSPAIPKGPGGRMGTHELTHLDVLEAEAIHIMREVAAELSQPVLLFSGGKDSIVLLRLAEKAFRPAPFPFPLMHVDTGHNFPEVHRVPRPPRGRARRAADRRLGAGVDRPRPRGRGDRAARVAQPAADDDAARRDRGARLRRRVRRRAPRRGARPREGADLLLPRRLRPVGPAPPAPRAVEHLQRAHPPRRARPRVPALQLDRARRLAVHRRGAPRGPVDLLRPRARGVPARRHALRAVAVRRAARRRGVLQRQRALPDGRRHELHRRGRVDRDRAGRRRRGDRRDRITERGETRADDRVSEAAMEDRKVAGYF